MIQTKVKICGLTKAYEIELVNGFKPDYIGFVFAESKRKVIPAQVLALRESLSPDIAVVGVFVNEAMKKVVDLIKHGIIDVVQLHGLEDEAYIKKLKSLIKAPIIKAIAVEKKGDVMAWADSKADYLLLDQKGGGTGQVFDWDLIDPVDKPYFLAGGLQVDNVTEAIRKTKPYAVDVSSGVESGGRKDGLKIKEFIERVRT